MNCIDKLIHRLLLIMLIAGWSILKVHASEQKGFSFPSARPEQLGMNQAKLEQAKLYSLSAGGSGMIVRHGQVVLRWGDQKKRYDIKSATKSFGATMLGIAIMDGKIELDAHAKRYHPNLGVHPQSNVETEWLDDITIRHLATQTAGFEKPGGYEKLLFKPGTHWHYSDGGPNWLAECITLQYRRDLEDLMFERVFTPLGITRDDLRWRKNQYREHEIEGIARREFGAGIHANVEALARLGYLYLHNGRWKDQQILAQDFVEMVRRPVESVVGLLEWSDSHGNASDHYSLLWWNNADGALAKVPRDAYWAWGLYDSLIVVIPSLDLVVVRGGERGRRLPRADGANHYYALKPLLEPIAAAVDALAGEENRFLFLMVKPGQVGMDGAKLEKAREYALTGGGSGCIIRGGRLVMAWGDQKQKYDIYSSTKSISVTALGLAIMDGKVNLHDKAKKYLPTLGTPPEGNARTGWLDELTLWHLATQTG
ncbi:MAG: serine hydrolase domain-containing protein, partial [Planctomycetota bacterium]